MKKTIIKYAVITVVFVLVAIILKSCLNILTNKMIEDEEITIESIEETNETLGKLIDKADAGHIGTIVSGLLEAERTWNIYPITQHFKDKFKNKYGIIPEMDNIRMVDGGRDTSKDNKLIPLVHCYWKDGYRNDGCIETIYYFDYKVDENEQLDDLILLRKVDYGEFGERLDGKKDVDILNIGLHIYAYMFPYDTSIDTYYLLKVPISDDCIVENKPDLNVPIEKIIRRDKNDNSVYMKFKYMDCNIILRVKYEINDDYQISYLNFNEISDNELPDKFKERFSEIN